ncbi:MAG TPA: hypothetical protein VNN62_05565 [Methylomirabilota bacterium]|jgi:hypothetical protein|nr:hypothetical protein [Methylomirabilota bacterium]
METAAITLVHAIPGRVRLKIPELRDNAALAARLRERLTVVTGVQWVAANSRTGSLVIQYDPVTIASPESRRALLSPLTAIFPAAVLPNFETWRAPNEESAFPPLAAGIRSFFHNVNEKLQHATGGHTDLRVLAPLLLLGLGLRAIVKSDKLAPPAWYDFLWFAFGSYFMLNPRPGEGQQ